MEKYDHLKLPIYSGNVERQKSKGKPQSPKIPSGRVKSDFSKEATQQ